MLTPSRTGTYVVIGLGTFGATAALSLARFGNHVIGIDRSDKAVSSIVEDIGQGLIIDARDDGALREAGLDDVDGALVAMASDMEASILSVINLRTMGIKRIWAKAGSKNHHRILSKIGATRVIHPEKDVGEQVAQMLHNPLVRDFMSLGNGQFVVNFRVPETLENKTLSELSHFTDHDLRCLGVMRGTEYLGHDGADCRLAEDDIVMMLGSRKDLRGFADTLER